jgi:hypothetical protein
MAKERQKRVETPVEDMDEPIIEQLEEGDHGAILLSWEFLERPRHERGRIWYSAMIAIGGGLLIYSLISANFLFALIIVMFSLVLYVSTIFEPSLVRITFSEDGVEIGDSFFPYRDIDKFWFYYEPPIARNLYLEFKSMLQPRLRVDLDEQNPNQVRQVLAQFVREDLERVEEPVSEMIGRIFKI